MDGATKKFIQEENEKLAFLISQHIGRLENKIDAVENTMATKDDVVRLENTIELGMMKRLQETDGLRDRMRVLETRVDHAGTVH